MQEIQELFNPAGLRTNYVDDAGMLWVHGGKLCEALGFSNPTQAIGLHVQAEDKTLVDVGAIQDAWFVSEPGMWSLILASKSSKAKEFKRLLVSVVLPSIRKNGYYIDPNATQAQLESLQRDILHHANWTVDEFLETLEEDQADRRLDWDDF